MRIYKPELAARVSAFLDGDRPGAVPGHAICCRHEPGLAKGTRIVNVCAGCDRRFRELYDGISTVSLWEVLAERADFPFPDYEGVSMAVHDACPTRTEKRVHDAVRFLLGKMNIRVVEPRETRTRAVCCGDSFHGLLPAEQVRERMAKRAAAMPCEDVVVYCVSCIKALHIGGRRPRYLVDLLFAEPTEPQECDPGLWHETLQKFIDAH